jgi:hypothetical protein
MAAVELIRATTNDLIRQCKEMVDEEEMAAASAATAEGREYMNASDPSVLRFLIAAREEVDSTQLRDDLLSMLVAGHETTGSALTWTLYLLVNNPDKMAIAQAGTRLPPSLCHLVKLTTSLLRITVHGSVWSVVTWFVGSRLRLIYVVIGVCHACVSAFAGRGGCCVGIAPPPHAG